MRQRVMQVGLVVLAAGTLLGASSDVVDAAGAPATPLDVTFTCCASKVVTTLYRPGETIRLHWSREQLGAQRVARRTYTLDVSINGPFTSVSALKDAVAKHGRLVTLIADEAEPVRVTNVGLSNPVSTVVVSPSAPTGYYELTTTVTTSSLSASGGAVIEVRR